MAAAIFGAVILGSCVLAQCAVSGGAAQLWTCVIAPLRLHCGKQRKGDPVTAYLFDTPEVKSIQIVGETARTHFAFFPLFVLSTGTDW